MADRLNGNGVGRSRARAGAEGGVGGPPEAVSPGALRVTLAQGPVADGSLGEGDAGASGARATTSVVEGEGARLELLEAPLGRLILDGAPHDVLVTPLPDLRRTASGIRRLEVVVDGWRFEVDVESESRARLRERATSAGGDAGGGGPVELRAIIPGRVVSVDVAEGDTVEAGGRLLVVEAMKMQNELRAPRAGTVSNVAVGAGQTVELGDLLLVIG